MRTEETTNEKLDTLASLGENWNRWRVDRKATPRSIRGAMIQLCKEVAAEEDKPTYDFSDLKLEG